MACVYVLTSTRSIKRYIGSSHENDPSIRLRSHNSGKVRSTKYGVPWEIRYSEHYDNYTEARKREIFLKSGQGRKFLDSLK